MPARCLLSRLLGDRPVVLIVDSLRAPLLRPRCSLFLWLDVQYRRRMRGRLLLFAPILHLSGALPVPI